MSILVVEGAPEELAEAWAAVRGTKLETVAWAFGLTLVAFALGRLAAWLVTRSIRRWAKHASVEADELVLRHLALPFRWLVPAIAIDWMLPMLSLKGSLGQAASHAAVIAIIVATGWAAFAGLRVIEDLVESRYDLAQAKSIESRAVYTQLRALRNIGSFLIVMITVAFALTTFQEVRTIGAGLLASAGVAGIVLGFAAQKTLTTLVAGIQIAFAQPIRVGDLVGVDSEVGTVEEIGLTYAVVRLWDLRRLIVPVQYFLDKPIQNWTRGTGELLGTVELSLDFGVPVDAIRKQLTSIVEGSPSWDKKTAKVHVTSANSTAMVVRVLVSAKDSDALFDLRCEVREKLLAFVHRELPAALPKQRVDGGKSSAA